MTEQTSRMKMLRAVALRADKFYPDAEKLGRSAAVALTADKRSQITNLESIANVALKVTDIYDFIKVRTARDAQQSDAKKKRGWHQEDLGPKLLAYLSRNLRDERNEICQKLQIDPNSAEGIHVHLLLIREFVRQLAAQYEYACKFSNAGGAG